MKLRLRTHSVQKNYIAIWYSILIHFLLLILAVNYIEMDVMGILKEVNLDFIAEFFSSASEPDKTMINELMRSKDYINFKGANFQHFTLNC